MNSQPYAVLADTTWALTKVDGDPANGELRYSRDISTLRVNWRPKATYGSYLVSRGHLGEQKSVRLFDVPAALWAYDANDHAVIGPADGETFFEVRGEGMNEQAFLLLLAQLRRADAATLEAQLPDRVVRPDKVAATIATMLLGVDVPARFDPSSIRVAPYQERYHIAARVSGHVGCAWVDEYAHGDWAARQRAVAAMGASRTWPVLQAIAHDGGWAEELWQVADDMAAGKSSAEMRQRISA